MARGIGVRRDAKAKREIDRFPMLIKEDEVI